MNSWLSSDAVIEDYAELPLLRLPHTSWHLRYDTLAAFRRPQYAGSYFSLPVISPSIFIDYAGILLEFLHTFISYYIHISCLRHFIIAHCIDSHHFHVIEFSWFLYFRHFRHCQYILHWLDRRIIAVIKASSLKAAQSMTPSSLFSSFFSRFHWIILAITFHYIVIDYRGHRSLSSY